LMGPTQSLWSIWRMPGTKFSWVCAIDKWCLYRPHITDIAYMFHNLWFLTIIRIGTKHKIWRMPSSGMWRHVAAIRTNFLERHIASIIVPSSLFLFTLMMEAAQSSEISVLTRAAPHHIPEDAILHSHCRENLKSYMALTGCAL
jgi:hypothetical protein